MRFSDMENARVGILGVGREGQAVWRHVRRRYPHKPLSLFSESGIDETFRLQLDPVIDVLHIGPLDVTCLRGFDVLVRSAGISVYRDELIQLRSLGVQFTSACSLWFAENPAAKTICVTGTSGKSTTATLIAQLLKQQGVNACLAGNIGQPMLGCENENVDWWVIELSSYQICDLEAKPDIAVFLNINEDHLDWHLGFENYKADKLRLAQLVTDGQLIANFSDGVLKRNLAHHPGITWFNKMGSWQADRAAVVRHSIGSQVQQSPESEISKTGLSRVAASHSLPGEHNMQNLASALTVVEALGLSIANTEAALSAFSGLPHRLQEIGERDGIRYVNDSISTTPFSVAAALQAIGHSDVVLLLGGMDRGINWTGFATQIQAHRPYAMIALPDNGPKIFECFEAAGAVPEGGLHPVADLEEAVALAEKLVPRKGCILLSPGAPSFPHFRDYEDRGEQFTRFSGF